MRVSLESFRFSGDLFYQEETYVPFRPGITLFRGINHDAIPVDSKCIDSYSNGTAKSRLPQILGAFIYNSSDLGHFKKMVLPDFKGTLQFRNLFTNTHWSFSFDMKENTWEILKDGQVHFQHHKPSECQAFLAEEIGYSKREWSNFVYINRNSLATLLKSKEPAERRKYLEVFFNIDEFYEEKRKEYVQRKQTLEEQLHTLSQTQARLGQVLDSLSKLESLPYLQNQLALLQESLALVTTEQTQKAARLSVVSNQLRVWAEYYGLCLEIQGKQSLADLKTLASDLRTLLADLKDKQKKKVQVESKVRLELKPIEDMIAGFATPEMPQTPEPQQQDISALEITISQMQAKAKLLDRFKAIKVTLPESPGEETEDELNQTRKFIIDKQAEIKLHINLVNGGKSCSKCGQSLEFILNNQDPKERLASLQMEEKALLEAVHKIDSSLTVLRRRQSILEQLRGLKEQIEAFSVFGRSLTTAEEELKGLKDTDFNWKTYNKYRQQHEARLQKKDILLAELKGLGYPEVLTLDLSKDIDKITVELNTTEIDLQSSQKHQDLLGQVINFSTEADLKTEEDTLQQDTQFNSERSKKLAELFGELKNQKHMVEQLEQTKLELQQELEPGEALQKELQLLEAMVKFFSPAGFKLFELRKRCEFLIERANYWSPVFFQEQYEWSLPEDLESINFLVQPVKHRATKPYPASQLSAGEENRAEKVLLFAQLDMAPPTKTINALFLDEIEGHLDAMGKLVFTEIVVPKLKETFNKKAITIISHEESLRRSADIDHLWLAERRNRKTKLTDIENYNRRTSL